MIFFFVYSWKSWRNRLNKKMKNTTRPMKNAKRYNYILIFCFHLKCYLMYHFKVTWVVVDSSSKYLTFILQATKEVQEKAGEIKTLKSQIHSLTEQVSHLEANKSQVITNKISELSGSHKARLQGLFSWAGTHIFLSEFLIHTTNIK